MNVHFRQEKGMEINSPARNVYLTWENAGPDYLSRVIASGLRHLRACICMHVFNFSLPMMSGLEHRSNNMTRTVYV